MTTDTASCLGAETTERSKHQMVIGSTLRANPSRDKTRTEANSEAQALLGEAEFRPVGRNFCQPALRASLS